MKRKKTKPSRREPRLLKADREALGVALLVMREQVQAARAEFGEDVSLNPRVLRSIELLARLSGERNSGE